MNKTSPLRTILLILRTVSVCGAVCFLSVKCTSGEQKKVTREAVEVIRAQNTFHSIPVRLEGTLKAPATADLSFVVSGKLEAGEIDLTPGTRFKKGQLLAQINNREAYDGFNRRKMALAAQLIGMMPDIRNRFPDEETKWSGFILGLKPENLVPGLPAFGTPAERDFITAKGIPEKHRALQQEQDGMKRYFYLAPFDGYVVEMKTQPGNTIRSGTVVAQLAKAGPLQLQLDMPSMAYLSSNSRDFMSTSGLPVWLPNGDTIGICGELIHLPRYPGPDPSVIRSIHGIGLTTRSRLKPGTRIQMTGKSHHSYETVLPATAIHSHFVQIVKNGKLETQRVMIDRKEGDSVFVSGVKNGDPVVVSFRRKTDRNVHYFAR
jgi:hypothetical protein